MNFSVLISGGAGYIGSATVKYFLDKGASVVVIDNLVTGHIEAIDKRAIFYEGDFSDKNLIKLIIKRHNINSAMHFSAFALVGESVENPAKYYENNVAKTIIFLETLAKNNVKYFIFSSTAATFGIPDRMPIDETFEQKPINPYGRSKLMVEEILKDFANAYDFHYGILRYFNACGALDDIGEDHNPETHIIPNIIKTALDENKVFKIFGNDYPTKDGTCVRDYIHIKDLASAHYLTLEYIMKNNKSEDFNLGNGKGFSNLEILHAAEKVIGQKINYEFTNRRPGDPPVLIASSKKINNLLGWKPEFDSIEKIIESAYKWHKKYPEGYKK